MWDTKIVYNHLKVVSKTFSSFLLFYLQWERKPPYCSLEGYLWYCTIRDRLTYQPGRYLGFTDISVSVKTAMSRCWQSAVIFLTDPSNLRKKAQWNKSRQLPCSNASRYIFINKQTRSTIKHMSAVEAKTKVSSVIRLIKNHSKILKLLQFEKF